MTNATRFQTDKMTFAAELEQLGLPKEHSTALCTVFNGNTEKLCQYLAKNTLSVNEVTKVTADIPDDGIDCACVTFDIKNELIDGVPMKTTHKININKTDVRILLKEMKTVQNMMEEFM